MAQFAAVAKLGTAIYSGFRALRDSRRKAFKPTPNPLPDQDALTMAAKRRAARRALQGGRVTTILSDFNDRLGG